MDGGSPDVAAAVCSIGRAVSIVGDRWTLLIVRQALVGVTRFKQFRDALGIAPDVLANRLSKLVDFGLLERRFYREDGARGRDEYLLTPSGRGLLPVLAALSGWSREFRPTDRADPFGFQTADGSEVTVRFVDGNGFVRETADVSLIPATGSGN